MPIKWPKRKKTIDSITVDELSMAKVKLEQEQQRVMRRVDELEKQKTQLDQQGRVEPSHRKQVLLAQKIQELESQARSYDKNLAAYQKQMRVINGLIFLKENRQSWEQTAVGDILGNLELGELEAYVDQATANNVFQMDKFERIIGTMDDSTDFTDGDELDAEVANTVSGWQRAREAGSVSAGLDELDKAFSAENEK